MCKYLQLLSISRGCQAAGRVGVKESPRGGEAPVLSLSSHRMERVTISSTYTSSQWFFLH